MHPKSLYININEKFITLCAITLSMIRATARLKAIGNSGVMLYIPKELRDELGLAAGDVVTLEAKEGTLSMNRKGFRIRNGF